MKRFIEFFVDNTLIMNLITIALLVAGIMFIVTARKEAFPKVDFDMVTVQTIYPGATASDVEKLLTNPIEDKIREVDGIEEIYSWSIEANSTILIKLDPNLKNKDKTITDIRSAVDNAEDIPADADDPIVTELSMKQHPVVVYSIVNKNGIKNDADEFELRKYAKALQDRIKDMPGVSGVPERGYRDREMLVEVNLAKLNDYHVSLNDVINALSGKNVDFPGGIAKTGSEEILIRTIGQVESATEISRIIIRSNDVGVPVKISDVANVKDSFEEEREIAKTMGEKSINLTVRIKENYDIIKLVTSVRKEVRSFEKTIPDNFKIVETDDLSQYVVRRLDVLKGNAGFGFALVIATLFFAFGWRIALVAAMGIPLSFAGTFFWMETANVSINLMSMFGLIMVLGMLVDDAIVVSENIYRLIEEKVPLKQAVVQGTSEVIVPVAGTILTTIVAFAPLMFMSGIIGKFVWVLPAVVSAALIFSWFESMLILPGHIYDMEKKRAHHHASKKPEDIHSPLKIRKRYKVLLTATVRNKYKTAGLIVLIFLASVAFGATHLKFDLFPATGIEKFVIKLESKSGTALEEMNTRVIAIEKLVSELPEEELDSFTTTVGVSQIEEGDPDTRRGSNYASIVVNLTPETDRERIASDIVDKMRQDMNQLSNLFPKIEVHLAKNGPPTGMPVSVAVKGDDIATLKEISKEFKDYLKNN